MAGFVENAHDAWRQAERDWLAVREHWLGVTRDHFDRVAWSDLENAGRRYVDAVRQLHEALSKASRLPRP